MKMVHNAVWGLMHLEEESIRFGMEGMIVRKVMRMSFVQNSKVKSSEKPENTEDSCADKKAITKKSVLNEQQI